MVRHWNSLKIIRQSLTIFHSFLYLLTGIGHHVWGDFALWTRVVHLHLQQMGRPHQCRLNYVIFPSCLRLCCVFQWGEIIGARRELWKHHLRCQCNFWFMATVSYMIYSSGSLVVNLTPVSVLSKSRPSTSLGQASYYGPSSTSAWLANRQRVGEVSQMSRIPCGLSWLSRHGTLPMAFTMRYVIYPPWSALLKLGESWRV